MTKNHIVSISKSRYGQLKKFEEMFHKLQAAKTQQELKFIRVFQLFRHFSGHAEECKVNRWIFKRPCNCGYNRFIISVEALVREMSP
jgi:hypothetical protein